MVTERTYRLGSESTKIDRIGRLQDCVITRPNDSYVGGVQLSDLTAPGCQNCDGPGIAKLRWIKYESPGWMTVAQRVDGDGVKVDLISFRDTVIDTREEPFVVVNERRGYTQVSSTDVKGPIGYDGKTRPQARASTVRGEP